MHCLSRLFSASSYSNNVLCYNPCIYVLFPSSSSYQCLYKLKICMGYTHTSDEMDRRVPVLLQFLVPGKSRHRSTPITACRTQRRSAPSLLGATLVATVTINVQTREPSPSLYLSPSLRLSVYSCLSLGACNCSASLYPH